MQPEEKPASSFTANPIITVKDIESIHRFIKVYQHQLLLANPDQKLTVVQNTDSITTATQVIALPSWRGQVPPDTKIIRFAINPKRQPMSFVIIPGTSAPPDHKLTSAAIDRTHQGAKYAVFKKADALVLSGFGSPTHPTEAQQMASLLPNYPLTLLLDNLANSTAANAVCTHQLIAALDPSATVTVFASWSNALRLHLLFNQVFRPTHVQTHVLFGFTHSASWYPGIIGLFHMKTHTRNAHVLLENYHNA